VIDEKMIYEITATARPEEIEELLDLSMEGRFDEAERLLSELIRDRGIAQTSSLTSVIGRWSGVISTGRSK